MGKYSEMTPFYSSQIPSDWTSPEFGKVFSFLRTFSFSRDQLCENETPERIQNIHYGDIHATFESEILDFKLEKQIPFVKQGLISIDNTNTEKFPWLKDGDLIITDVSEDYEGLCDCVELANLNGKRVVSGLHTFAVRANSNVALGFRAYVFRHPAVIKELRRIATGISVYSVSKAMLEKLKLPLPPPSEQKIIAHILSLVDKAIHKQNRLVSCKEQRKKWLMQQLLSGTKRLSGFEGKWKEYKITELFQLTDRYIDWDDTHLYNLVSIRRRFGGLFFRGDLLGEEISVKCLKEVHENDFLISKRQVAHGAWAVVPKEFNGGKVSDEYECLTIKNSQKLSSDFWAWYCQQPIMRHYAFLDSNGVHIEKLIFDFDQFKKRKVVLPPTIEEQTAIARLLQATDKEIRLLRMKTEKLKEQKKWLMQVLLTGKKRFKTNQGEEKGRTVSNQQIV